MTVNEADEETGEGVDYMILTKYIAKNCILTDIKSESKADVLKQLAHHLFEKKKMTDEVGPALDQIVAREVTESTGIGRGIAVPHARVVSMKSMACALARIKGGLDFTAVDRKPVHLIFLICYPPSEQTTYLNFVATVAKLLRDQDLMKKMLTAKDADELFDLLEKTSQKFTEKHERPLTKIETDPSLGAVRDAHTDLILLARMQLCQEMLAAARTGKAEIKSRIENIRSLVSPRVLTQFDRIMKNRPPALVAVEGDTCQGCFMKLPSKFVQQVRGDGDRIHACPNCSRFIYVV
jgi:mannitol/fructose-specific phosphotransferase system IIA component (Ntr-type)